jgi:hypothetical protein
VLSAETQIFFPSNARFSAQLAAPWNLSPWEAATLVPTPNTYATGYIGCISPLFCSAVVHGFKAPPLHLYARWCGYKKHPLSYRGSSDPQQVPAVACLCHQRPARISLLLFWLLLRLPKRFSRYMTSSRSLFVLFSVFSFRCKLRPQFHLGVYALQSR